MFEVQPGERTIPPAELMKTMYDQKSTGKSFS